MSRDERRKGERRNPHRRERLGGPKPNRRRPVDEHIANIYRSWDTTRYASHDDVLAVLYEIDRLRALLGAVR